MRTELPACRRCCFCFPLRYGLITWGYIKLIAGVTVTVALMVTLYSMVDGLIRYGDQFYSHHIVVLSVVLLVLLTDVALSALFIIGGHSKNVKLLRVYYIYSVVVWALTIGVVLVMGFLMLQSVLPDHVMSFRSWVLLLDLSSSFVNIIMQSYFLLLLRSEIIKLRNNCDFQFVNNTAEAECTMRYKQELVDEEKGTGYFCGTETCETENVCEKTCRTNGHCHENENQI